MALAQDNTVGVVTVLGTTQTLAWASSYYLPAILADPMARDLGVSTASVFAAFSVSMVISALLGPRVGRTIDLVGGREVLAVSNLLMAGGLIGLGLSRSGLHMWLAWGVLGAGMGLGLYDAGFATLGRIYGAMARRPITGITLLAGFASTVGWPLSAWGLADLGWRHTCFAWAAAHLLIGLPLNLLLLPRPGAAHETLASVDKPTIPIDRTMVLLAFTFAAGWLVAGAMGAHLPRILEAAGATPVEAIAAGALFGPAQVAARLLEAGFLTRYHPLLSARLCCAAHPIGAAIFALSGAGAAAGLFAVLHGAGNGILTIARGTLPLALYGPKDYGYRLGLLGAPARMAQAAAPVVFDILIEWMGARVLWVTSGLCLAALAALLLVKQSEPPSADP